MADSAVVQYPPQSTSEGRKGQASRTDVISAELRKQLDMRRSLLDSATDLGEVTITVKLQVGTTWVRGIVWEEERLCQKR